MKKIIFFILSVMCIILLAFSFSCDSINQGEKESSVNSTADDKADTGPAKYLINNSTIYKVEKDAVWTTTLNMLQVITRFAVTGQTEIFLDGKPAKLEQLKPGFRVTIYYYINPAGMSIIGSNIAVRIAAYSKYSVL